MTEKLSPGTVQRDPRPAFDLGQGSSHLSQAQEWTLFDMPRYAIDEVDAQLAAYVGYEDVQQGILDELPQPSQRTRIPFLAAYAGRALSTERSDHLLDDTAGQQSNLIAENSGASTLPGETALTDLQTFPKHIDPTTGKMYTLLNAPDAETRRAVIDNTWYGGPEPDALRRNTRQEARPVETLTTELL